MIRNLTLLLVPALAIAASGRSPFAEIRFEPNVGQSPAAVRYFARAPGTAFAFRDGGIEIATGERPVRLRFAGMLRTAAWEPLEATADRTVYVTGKSAAAMPEVRQYRKLAWHGIYPGIDAIFYGHGGHLEYDLVVAPGADLSRVRIRFEGAGSVSTNAAGDMVVQAGRSSLTMRVPRVYQRKGGAEVPVAATYRLNGREIQFTVGAYDRAHELVVDPVLVLSAYYGGERDESVVAVTPNGDYVGTTTSSAFGDGRRRTRRDIFAAVQVSQVNGLVLYIFGGAGDDVATAAVSISNGLVIAGWTDSDDFATPAAGGADALLISIRRQFGSSPPTVLRFGGSGDDRIYAANAINASQIYFAGETNSPDLKLNGVPLGTSYKAGKDALAGSMSNGFVDQLAYYGGSGDDSAYAIAADGTFAGKTNSPDLRLRDPLSSELSGPSDAFIAKFDGSGFRGTAGPVFATYFGGSGEDEIRATAVGTGTSARVFSFAGTTTSTDLPLLAPWQPQYGGGESDAFAGRIDLTTKTLLRNTYIGGSGRDEASAMASNTGFSIGNSGPGDDVIAGFTTSPNLPVKAAFQERLNGLQDAWVGAWTPDGGLEALTYFGGSGSDRALAVTMLTSNTVAIAGDTDSTDLPEAVPNTAPGVALGGKDGFVAGLVLARLAYSSEPIWIAKSFTAQTSIFLSGDFPDSARVTVTSSDPSKVLVSLNQGTPAASISLPIQALNLRNSSYLSPAVTGVAESGEAEITVEVEGVLSQKFTARLGKPQVRAGFATPLPTLAIGQSYYLSPSMGVVDDAGLFHSASLAVDAPRPAVTYTVSNNLIRIEPATIFAGDFSASSSAILTVLGAGEATISMTAEGIEVFGQSSATYTILAPAVTLTDLAIAKDTQASYQFRVSGGGVSGPVTVTSDSPDKICILEYPGLRECSASSTAPASNGFTLRGLSDSGIATLRYETASNGSGSVAVQLSRPKLFLTRGTTGLNLPEGSTTPIFVSFGTALDRDRGATLAPGVTAAITVTSSDPAVLAVTKGPAATEFRLDPKAPGRVVLTASAPGFEDADPLDVTVTARQANKFDVADRVLLGRDLQSALTVPVSNGVQIRARSSAPDRLLISTDLNRVGLAEVQNTNTTTFYLQGSAAEGEATVTLSANGYADKVVTVQFSAAGFAWRTAAVAVTASGSVALNYGVFALDPESGVPVVAQSFRPGVSGTPTIVNSNPAVGDVSTSGTPSFRAKGLGSTTLSLDQPAGFTKPSLRSDLRVVVNPGTLFTSIPSFAGKDLQTPITVEPPANGRATIRSSDPSRLLIATAAREVGAGELTVGSGPKTLFLQGLAGEGTVNLTVSGEGLEEKLFVITMVPATVVLSPESSRSGIVLTTFSNDYTVTAAVAPLLPIGGGGGLWMVRAGAPSLQVPVVSSDPSIARPVNSPLVFEAGSSQGASVNIRPVGAGRTRITAAPTGDLRANPQLGYVEVTVERPSFQPQKVTVGRDLISAAPLYLKYSVTGPDTLLLTVTSSDASRAIVAPAYNAAGQGRIVMPFNINSPSSGQVTVYGISEGTAVITVSAPGFEDTRFEVTITPPQIYLNDLQTLTVGQNIQLPVGTNGAVRPGGRVTVNLRSSDPSVATVAPSVTIEEGQGQAGALVTARAPGKTTITVDGEGIAPVSKVITVRN